MENIYKIKVKSNPDPRWLYPSERRYSASIVLGLGVVHLALAGTALLLACLTLTANEALNNELPSHNNTNNVSVKPQDMIGITNNHQGDPTGNNNAEPLEDRSTETFDFENASKTGHDLSRNKQNVSSKSDESHFDSITNITLAPCIMCLGSLAAGLTGLLAWKRWYIDHNIKWFFCMSLLSTITSSICLVLILILVVITSENFYDVTSTSYLNKPSAKYAITVNILIASILEWLWSILSTKVAFAGMRNNYPDDIVISKSRGKIQVNTVHKGNKKGKVAPPDILNHFPVSGKIAKYLPKKTNGNLPKDESNSEYQERVNKFLSANVEVNSAP